MFNVGRVCVKTAGREAGRYCIVVQKPSGRNVLVTGPSPGVRRRSCNLAHLEPLLLSLSVPAEASDEAVQKAWESSEVPQKLRLAPRKARAPSGAEAGTKRAEAK